MDGGSVHGLYIVGVHQMQEDEHGTHSRFEADAVNDIKPLCQNLRKSGTHRHVFRSMLQIAV